MWLFLKDVKRHEVLSIQFFLNNVVCKITVIIATIIKMGSTFKIFNLYFQKLCQIVPPTGEKGMPSSLCSYAFMQNMVTVVVLKMCY